MRARAPGAVDKSETLKVGTLALGDGPLEVIQPEDAEAGKLELVIEASEPPLGTELLEESLVEGSVSSSSSSLASEDSVSVWDFARSPRILVRLLFPLFSRVNVRRRALRTGATGLRVSGRCFEISSSESLDSPLSFEARRGYRNWY